MDSDAATPLTTAELRTLGEKVPAADASALEQLLQFYHRRFAGHIARKIGAELRGKVEPDDILQETYVQVFARASDFCPEHEDSFYRWVCFLIDRTLIDRIRHLRRQKRDAAREVLTPSSRHDQLLERCRLDSVTPSRIVRRDEALCALMSAIAQLPEQDRAVVRRLYLDEQSAAQVAADLKCSENWVRRIGSRAIERLNRRLRSRRFSSAE